MQQHDNQPLNDFTEYPHDEMLERAQEFLATSQEIRTLIL